ncbi:MAG TPA: hypothetical protein VFI42_14225 [Thermomicrobiaceae bacterium]|nr:hypothetical protein [Thermomicrobiaceae bacterium]HEX5505905.1 hypothetical protein [Thermomicrobiales bacterium]
MATIVPTLLITGPVGVGKTTVASEVSELLEAARIAHAFVDIDALRWCYPGPPGDRFRAGLALRNLAAIWPNFAACGATRLVLADVLEDRAELAGYQRALPGAAITVVRLRAAPETLAARVARRELGAGLEWHLARARELAARMDARPVEDLLVETEGRGVRAVAEEIVRRAGWLSPAAAPPPPAPG